MIYTFLIPQNAEILCKTSAVMKAQVTLFFLFLDFRIS